MLSKRCYDIISGRTIIKTITDKTIIKKVLTFIKLYCYHQSSYAMPLNYCKFNSHDSELNIRRNKNFQNIVL